MADSERMVMLQMGGLIGKDGKVVKCVVSLVSVLMVDDVLWLKLEVLGDNRACDVTTMPGLNKLWILARREVTFL